MRILVVDATNDMCRRLEGLFGPSGAAVVRVSNLDRVLECFESESFDVLLIDSKAFKAGRADGIELLEVISTNSPMTQVIFLAEREDLRTAFSALKAGSFQYARLPLSDLELKLLVETSLERRPVYGANLLLRSKAKTVKFQQLIGRAPSMQNVYQQIQQAAATDVPVLISGETGTGKDLVAQAIHARSPRAKGPFVPVNLGALPAELVPGELFGHEKGAFTGAMEQRSGKFEQANNGTIFLDEINAIDEKVQVGLLRLIEEKRFHRLGGRQSFACDARIIAATNADLRSEVKAGRFRQDLFYRLDVFPIVVPPLRARQGDLTLLIDAFLKRYNTVYQKSLLGISPGCMSLLESYDWPGNVRELKNVIQRAVLICDGPVLLPDHLPQRMRSPQRARGQVVIELGTPLRDVERAMIARTLRAVGNNRKKAAELLGISRRALYNKLAKYGID